MTDRTLRHTCTAIVIAMLALGATTVALGQTPTPNGAFLCSAGPRDGAACNSDADCLFPPGVCVIAQGVCDGGTDDGFPCDCASGTCQAQPVCSTDATLGTCHSGPSAGECCDVTTNCAGGVLCRGTQKVCLAGDNKCFSCLRDAECPGSSCASTGKFCNGGDFDGFACVDNTCCPSGTCVTILPTDTPTRVIFTATATRTKTNTPTKTPVSGTPTTPTRTPTLTPVAVGTTVIPSAIPSITATLRPTATPVRVRPTNTPPSQGVRQVFIAEGGGCTLGPSGGGLLALIGAALLVPLLRRRRAR